MANIQYGVTIELEPIEGGEKIYDVRVTVNKKFTRDPIAGASVFMAGQATEITNAEGKCYFFNVPSGTYNISVSCNGYKPTTVSITLE